MQMLYTSPIAPNSMFLDTVLNKQITGDDLRKVMFLNTPNPHGMSTFKGSYTGGTRPFTGLSIDELYLTLTECYARLGREFEANETLALFKIKWYKPEYIEHLEPLLGKELLTEIMIERRKQLFFRGIRWIDLKRVGFDPEHFVTLEKHLITKYIIYCL
ncbi:hypothetical protein MM239_01910 [Belliella sp. DSM 111904]|uniref:DUF1343 domain-containing protein n=1 Tax=Belliella filtrata TaxID=2923435 RepID=A0ABS9UVE4_9BACT|nr:hypothetical protein [Belliella filtrata]MCH7408136.1 hypothetical protein [Belliella filtrata]